MSPTLIAESATGCNGKMVEQTWKTRNYQGLVRAFRTSQTSIPVWRSPALIEILFFFLPNVVSPQLQQSEYSKKFVPLDTQRRKKYGPQQLYEKGTSTFYHETTSRNDYRSWPTEAVYHGKKHDYRPFNATFNYNTTYKHDFENKVCLPADLL